MLAAGSFGIDIDSVNLTPRVVAIISRWIFPIHPGVVPLCASDATRDCQKGLQRLGSTRFADPAGGKLISTSRDTGTNVAQWLLLSFWMLPVQCGGPKAWQELY
ncbi:hypothetical protein PC118_g15834 [Phytophthora cactorum]|uniref:Uncharacterized protein n=1 Tax=Phytophthora cactorum TaxID=29920 RepID=A0A8T0YCE6_9STRA|nr:hypothetical protein PC111_g11278 [Phytophthora cactorum]KAG2840692.1 hypothetical protein PC113_g19204 [Phytophthora cactorum]KAG2890403.1 hypothetical protein PC114_g17487 [Phytophthora cactorum]KAG2903236.1 hypothetical protein PC115_g15386 [Phytophthora cactorum]KAG2972173.1 hypothetical protein PC118_g15834 [Phytophthora cactorum]